MMAADIAKTAADTFSEWEKGIFSLGFVNTIIYAAIAAVVAFVLIKLIQHFFAKKFSGNARIFYRLIYVAIAPVGCAVMAYDYFNCDMLCACNHKAS
ncbi:MAG: hypothetical protein RSB97_00290 [Christensenella sp.]